MGYLNLVCRLALVMMLATLSACGSGSSDTTDTGAEAPAAESTNVGVAAGPAGAMCATGFQDPCAAAPTSEANSLCGSIVMPANYTGGAIRVSYHLFESTFWNAETNSPLGPPAIFVWEAIPMGEEITRPTESNADLTAIQPCAAYAIRIPSDAMKMAAQPGKSYYVYSNVYLPNGGADTWAAEEGIDYVGASAAPVELNGAGLNVAPIILTLK